MLCLQQHNFCNENCWTIFWKASCCVISRIPQITTLAPTGWPKQMAHFIECLNFVKYWPIFKRLAVWIGRTFLIMLSLNIQRVSSVSLYFNLWNVSVLKATTENKDFCNNTSSSFYIKCSMFCFAAGQCTPDMYYRSRLVVNCCFFKTDMSQGSVGIHYTLEVWWDL